VSKIKWSYGVTTVPERRHKHLLRTLASLKRAGFEKPTLFVDNPNSEDLSEYNYSALNLRTVYRTAPGLRTFGNWILAMWELYLLKPEATYFAIFQDDFVTYPNLRSYLEQCKYPEKGYWNLYTFPVNQMDTKGWYPAIGRGKGAIALIFDRKAVMRLLSTQHLSDRVQNPARGWRSVDGAVYEAMRQIFYVEYVHNPSLTQHTGTKSSMKSPPQKFSPSFIGENFDALSLLQEKENV